MVFKNLLRRKARTLLTIFGISLGVAAIIGLGALADGLQTGYSSMLTGSKADLILSQPDAYDISFSSVDEAVGKAIQAMPEVSDISGMLEGFVQTEGEPFFFVFGYPENSFVIDRFQILEGTGLFAREARQARGKPIMLGSAAAEVMDKSVGDTLRVGDSVFRIVGIYQTGDAFEDSGALLPLPEAQNLLGKARQVSLFYIRLKSPDLQERFTKRVARQFPELSLSGAEDFASKQSLLDILRAYVWVIGGLAILIGGVGMMNAQLMAVFERTREIGVLRALGWSGWRVLWMILGESMVVGFLGGLVGVGLAWLMLMGVSRAAVFFGVSATSIRSGLLAQAFVVVSTLGLVGGLYPAWRAARLQPVEALRYEGGSAGGDVRRLPVGGMAVQSLWQRSIRTALTLGAIAITIGTIVTLEGIIRGFSSSFTNLALGAEGQIMIRQADIADTSLSAIDDRIGDKIAAMSGVAGVSGMSLTAVVLPDQGGFFVLQGYAPNEFAIRRLKIVEGRPLSSNHQIILGRLMADALNKGTGDTIELGGTRFRIEGVYESTVGWEELGGVITLRDAQAFIGRPRKVTMFAVKLWDPSQAEALVSRINQQFPEVHASLTGDFVQQMPDMQNSDTMINAISFFAILVGGVGVLNTMLMAVLERTREIGVLRALGWQGRAVLGMILRESILLGLLGGICGIGFAFGLTYLTGRIPLWGNFVTPSWEWDVLIRAITVAVLLGLLGGLYPAYRATRLQPIEAIRYE